MRIVRKPTSTNSVIRGSDAIVPPTGFEPAFSFPLRYSAFEAQADKEACVHFLIFLIQIVVDPTGLEPAPCIRPT